MANKNQEWFKIVAVIIGAYILLGPNGLNQPAAVPPAGNGNGNGGNGGASTIPIGCAYAPTVQLQEVDKWDTALPQEGSYTYILNGGTSTSDTDGSFEVSLGDSLTVLWGNSNATYYNDIGTYTISKCGLNTIKSVNNLKSGQSGLIGNSSITIQCINDENQVVDTTLRQNVTMGAGEAYTVACDMRVTTTEKGTPHGAVLVVELASGTVYEEQKTVVTGPKIGASTAVPSAHTLSAAANKALAYEVTPIFDTARYDLNVYLKAETAQNPGSTNDVTLYIYSVDCFENSETGQYMCDVVTEDDAFSADLIGESIIEID